MPSEVLAHSPHASDDHTRRARAQCRDSGSPLAQSVQPDGRSRPTDPAPTAHLFHGRVRQELCPNRLDDVEAVYVVQIIFRKVPPGQGAIVANDGLEPSATLLKNRIAVGLCVQEVEVTIDDGDRVYIHNVICLWEGAL